MSTESATIQSDPPSEKPLNETSHPVQITTIKLKGDNFLRWSQSVRMYIRGRGKIGYLTGDKAEPAKNESTWAIWDAENSMIMTWLTNSMEEEIGANYMCYHTAKELWDSVCEMYSDLGNQSQIYELTLKLGQMQQGDETVTKYFNSLKRLWQDLDLFNDYEWKSVEDCNHNKKIMEANRIYKFLAGLREEFDEVRGRILGKQPLPPIGEVFSEVRREESRRSVMLGKTNSGEKNTAGGPLESSALAIPEAHASRTNFNPRRQDGRPRIWCDFCNRPRHTRETCWKLHGRPAIERNSQPSNRMVPTANEAVTGSFSKDQINHLLQLLKSGSVSGNSSASIAHKGSNLNAVSCSSNSAPWIIDSGASDHMTSLPYLFTTYVPCPGNQKIRIADGSFSSIAGKGSIPLTDSITLHNVLHVPKLACNLLSVSQLSKDSNCCVVFFASHCEF